MKTLKQRLIERTLRSMTPAERAKAKAETRSIPERARALTFERTDRRNGKWAKLTREARDRFTLATGWEGELRAREVQTFSQRDHAETYLAAWLDD